MTLLDVLMEAVNARMARMLLYAEMALPERQFRPYRRGVLKEFGHDGLERDFAQIVADHERRNGKESGRPIHAGKEVPHD